MISRQLLISAWIIANSFICIQCTFICIYSLVYTYFFSSSFSISFFCDFHFIVIVIMIISITIYIIANPQQQQAKKCSIQAHNIMLKYSLSYLPAFDQITTLLLAIELLAVSCNCDVYDII